MYVQISTEASADIYMFIYTYVHIHIYIYMHKEYVYMKMCLYVYKPMCTRLCVHIYTYTEMHTFGLIHESTDLVFQALEVGVVLLLVPLRSPFLSKPNPTSLVLTPIPQRSLSQGEVGSQQGKKSTLTAPIVLNGPCWRRIGSL